MSGEAMQKPKVGDVVCDCRMVHSQVITVANGGRTGDRSQEACMSYARWGWNSSDVYIYGGTSTGGNVLVCCGCDDGDCPTYGDMLRHISKHRAAGQHVPAYVDERLQAEIADPAQQWVEVGELPETMHPDPGPQRPEPPQFTQLREMVEKAWADEDRG
jgi:hypothetical protein